MQTINYSTTVQDYFVHLTNECKDEARFTQDEKCFVLEFLADTLNALTQLNSEGLREDGNFLRMYDCAEVAQNYVTLLNKCTDEGEDADEYTFTLEDAGAAICSYDTEYRECIQEQFEDALNEYFALVQQNKLQKLDIANCLAWRIFNSY